MHTSSPGEQLIIIPTQSEADLFIHSCGFNKHEGKLFVHSEAPNTHLLVCGPGMVASAYALTKTCMKNSYSRVIMAGLAGAYTTEIPKGSLCVVGSECLADLGYPDGNGSNEIFLHPDWQEHYGHGSFTHPEPEKLHGTGLPVVRSNTVNLIHPRPAELPSADIENMEGAAFFMIALQLQLEFLEIRAISNYTGERNKENWATDKAINAMNRFLCAYCKLDNIN